mgnify:FL=1
MSDEMGNIWLEIKGEQKSLRNKIAKRLEDASHELQFCEDASDIASILVDLLNEIAEMLKE